MPIRKAGYALGQGASVSNAGYPKRQADYEHQKLANVTNAPHKPLLHDLVVWSAPINPNRSKFHKRFGRPALRVGVGMCSPDVQAGRRRVELALVAVF
jgi:hypothetical protein